MLHLQLSDSYSQLPNMDLTVDGVVYSFLVDTGATRTSISGKMYKGTITASHIATMGIGGTPV